MGVFLFFLSLSLAGRTYYSMRAAFAARVCTTRVPHITLLPNLNFILSCPCPCLFARRVLD